MSTKFIVEIRDTFTNAKSVTVEANSFEIVSGVVIFHNGDITSPVFAVDSTYFMTATKETNQSK